MFGQPESSRSLFFFFFFFFGHHDWTDKYVVVTAETVNTKHRQIHSLLSYRRASRCFNQNTNVKKTKSKQKETDSGTKSEYLVSKIVSELVSNQSGHCNLRGGGECTLTTYGFSLSTHTQSHVQPHNQNVTV